jgi:hypothetical protein
MPWLILLFLQLGFDPEMFADVLDAIPESVTGNYAVEFRHLLNEIIKINEKRLHDSVLRKGALRWQHDRYVELAMAGATDRLLLPSSKKEKREQMFLPPSAQINIRELVSGCDNFSCLPGLRNGLVLSREAPDHLWSDEKDDSTEHTHTLSADFDEFRAACLKLFPFRSTDVANHTHQLFQTSFDIPLQDLHHVYEFLSRASLIMRVDAHEIMGLSVPLCIELDASGIDFVISDCVIAAHYFQQVLYSVCFPCFSLILLFFSAVYCAGFD